MAKAKLQKESATLGNYRALSEFRYHIRRYLEFSDQAARAAGVEPQQYQLLLAIKGLPVGVDPTVGELAERLNIRHHSAVELVNRAVNNDLVQRDRSDENRSFVLVSLTKKGDKILTDAVAARLEELETAGPILVDALKRLISAKRNGKRK